eukprot:7818918-Pyramimonas_sp.AAC.1
MAMSDEYIVAEAFMARNQLLNGGGFSPYQALYGRQPAQLQDLDQVSAAPLQDDVGGLPGLTRHAHRIRELANTAMVEATAAARVQRALESQTRTSGQGLELQVGDFVDILRKTDKKGITNWIGPCKITDMSDMRDGLVHCKWQGRPMSVRIADIREALYMEFLHFASSQDSSITGISTVMTQ